MDTEIRETLERAKRIFAERPASARKPNTSATATLTDRLRCEIAGSGGEHALTDMPPPMGGAGSAPNPGWMLRASIASCLATTIALRAALLGIRLQQLEVSVHSESDARGLLDLDGASTAFSSLRIHVRIRAEGLSPQLIEELVRWAEVHSPVSCTLSPGMSIPTEIQVL